MVKTVRIEDEEIHKDLVRVQGEMQIASGESTKLEKVIEELIKSYRKSSRKRK